MGRASEAHSPHLPQADSGTSVIQSVVERLGELGGFQNVKNDCCIDRHRRKRIGKTSWFSDHEKYGQSVVVVVVVGLTFSRS